MNGPDRASATPSVNPQTPTLLRRAVLFGTLALTPIACGDDKGTETSDMSTGVDTEVMTSTSEVTTDPDTTRGATENTSATTEMTDTDMTTVGTTESVTDTVTDTDSTDTQTGSETDSDTDSTTTIDPTGESCQDDFECPEFGSCDQDKGECVCNNLHTGDECNTCVASAVKINDGTCVDNPCEPENPCSEGPCTVDDNNGEAQCQTPPATILNAEVNCTDGPNNDECQSGGNQYDVTGLTENANTCSFQTSNGVIFKGGLSVNPDGTFDNAYITPNNPGPQTITINCTGDGGPSADYKLNVDVQ